MTVKTFFSSAPVDEDIEEKLDDSLCQRIDCDNEAKWIPGLRMWPEGMPKTEGASATCHIGLQVCDKHKEDSDIDFYVTDEGWQVIVQTFVTMGLALPDRASLELFFEPLYEPLPRGDRRH